MATRLALIGFPDIVTQSYTTVATTGAVGLEPPDMVADWIKTPEPSDLSRLLTLDPTNTQWKFYTSGVSSEIGGFAIVNHNITRGGQVRFLGAKVTSALTLAPSEQPPNSVVLSTNVTSPSTAPIDEQIYFPDGSFLSPTTDTDPWVVRFGFPALSGTLHAGDDMHCFVLRCRLIFTGAGDTNPLTYPKVTVTLGEAGGGNDQILGYRAVSQTAAGGQIFIFPFSKSQLVDQTGGALEVEVAFSPGLSASGGSYATLETLSLYYENTLAWTSPDSGWITVPGDSRPSPVQPTKSLHYFTGPDGFDWSDLTAFTIMVRSDQAQHDPPTNTVSEIPVGVIAEADTFVEIGTATVGAAVEFEEGNLWIGAPPAVVYVDEGTGTTGPGRPYGFDSFKRRTSQPVQMLVTRDELTFIQDQLAWRRGHSGAFYVAMEPGVPLEDQLLSAFWATVKEIGAPEWAGIDNGEDRYTISIAFDERL